VADGILVSGLVEVVVDTGFLFSDIVAGTQGIANSCWKPQNSSSRTFGAGERVGNVLVSDGLVGTVCASFVVGAKVGT